MKRIALIVGCLLWHLGAPAQTAGNILGAEDLHFLREMTADVTESSRIRPGESVSPDFGPNGTGGVLIRPGGRDCYPSFWIRDYALSLDCGAAEPSEQLHMLRLTAATQCDAAWITKNGSFIPLGSIADHVRIDDSKPIYFPGTYSYEEQGRPEWGMMPPYGDHFFFIHMAYYYVQTTGNRKILNEIIEGISLTERLERAFGVVPSHADNQVVYTTEAFRGVDFGFRDAVRITGDNCIASVFKYRAALEMAALHGIAGNRERTAYYTDVAQKLKTAIPAIFADERGMLKASTGISPQPDVWSTALAVYYGILEGEPCEKACRTLAESYRNGTLAHKGNVRHVPTSDDHSETTAWEQAMPGKNFYQNGGYWGTATGWVCYAVAQADPDAAAQMAREYVNDLRANDYRKGPEYGAPYEWFNREGTAANPVYLTTVSAPLGVFAAEFPQVPVAKGGTVRRNR